MTRVSVAARIIEAHDIRVISAYNLLSGAPVGVIAAEMYRIPVVVTNLGEIHSHRMALERQVKMIRHVTAAATVLTSLTRHCAGATGPSGCPGRQGPALRDRSRAIRRGTGRGGAPRQFGIPAEADVVLYVGRLVRDMGLHVLLDPSPICWRVTLPLGSSWPVLPVSCRRQWRARWPAGRAGHPGGGRSRGRPAQVLRRRNAGRGSDTRGSGLRQPRCRGSHGLGQAGGRQQDRWNPGVRGRGETGLLVPPADPGALVGAVLELLADPDRGRASAPAAANGWRGSSTVSAPTPARVSLPRGGAPPMIWSVVQQIGGQVATMIVYFALAALLPPRDFGLLGMAGAWLAVLNAFCESGFGAALIQREQLRGEHLSSTFAVNLAVGAALTLLGITLSYPASRFFSTPELQPVMAVLSLAFLVRAVGLTQVALAQRELRFRALAVRDVSANVLGGATGLALALAGYGVWSLVGMTLVNGFVATAMVWRLGQWRPRLSEVSRQAVAELWPYSSRMLGFNLFKAFAQNIDRMIIGRLLGVHALGLYAFASKSVIYPVTTFVGSLGAYLFPRISRLQSDAVRVKVIYRAVLIAVLNVVFPLLAGLVALAPAVIPILGEQGGRRCRSSRSWRWRRWRRRSSRPSARS